MKLNRVTCFVLLAISIIILTVGFVLFYQTTVNYGFPSLFLFALGFSLLIYGLFGTCFNKTFKKHSNTKTIVSATVVGFILYCAYVFVFMLIGEIDFNPILAEGVSYTDYIARYLNRFVFSAIIVLGAIISTIALTIYNFKVRKEDELLKRGILLDFVLGLPLGASIFIALLRLFYFLAVY